MPCAAPAALVIPLGASRKLAWLKHPAVFFSFGLHPSAQLWDATLGGANRTSRCLGAHAERRRSHPSYAGKALLLASYGTGALRADALLCSPKRSNTDKLAGRR